MPKRKRSKPSLWTTLGLPFLSFVNGQLAGPVGDDDEEVIVGRRIAWIARSGLASDVIATIEDLENTGRRGHTNPDLRRRADRALAQIDELDLEDEDKTALRRKLRSLRE